MVLITSPRTVVVELHDGGQETIEFENLIIATGSVADPAPLYRSRFASTYGIQTDALELREIPRSSAGHRRRLYRHGDGNRLRGPGFQGDRGRSAGIDHRRCRSGSGGPRASPVPRRRFEDVLINTKVTEVVEKTDGMHVKLLGIDLDEPHACFDKILVSVGRRPNSRDIGLENTAVEVDAARDSSKPIISAARPSRTFSRLAMWRANRCWRTRPATRDAWPLKCWPARPPRTIPSVFRPSSSPIPNWPGSGITETEARNRNIPYKIAAFPWAAAGRATSLDRNDGLTKMIVDPNSEVILGIGIVGVGAGELIAEGALAIEMGCTITDLKMTVHAHPTLSETVMESAEVYHGQSAHYMPRK